MRILVILLAAVSLSYAGSPEIEGCSVFTSRNIWNTPVDKLPATATSAARIANIGGSKSLHPDFSTDPTTGIPINSIAGLKGVKRVAVKFEYVDESDRMLYPIPPNMLIEGGPSASPTADRHMIVVDKSACEVYELFAFRPPSPPETRYLAAAGAVWDLHSDKLRPQGWTSVDAAGLPLFAGLVRYDEVAKGAIEHALRFTAPQTANYFIWPARHYASHASGTQLMPMGTRLRLKASVDISKYSKTNQVILQALKKYGMMLADNGGAWFLTGVPDPRWNNADLENLKKITGDDFEEVNAEEMIAAVDTAEIEQ
jgi:hypothetical protein